MLFLSGYESWSETFFGSANDPPPSLPCPLTCRPLELWILPWGMQKLTQVSPEPPPPHNFGQDLTEVLKKKDLMKDIL